VPTIEYDWIGGYCPLQAEGTIDGNHFYFRAKGTRWEFAIDEIGNDAVDIIAFTDRPGFKLSEQWIDKNHPGDINFSAGYMPESVAKQIIEDCAKKYMESKVTLG
jgi:hypothetical protein